MKSSDQRGQVHHFTTQRSGEYMVFYRNKGAVTAQHYHKGLSQQKNPEQFLLLQGTATCRDFLFYSQWGGESLAYRRFGIVG